MDPDEVQAFPTNYFGFVVQKKKVPPKTVSIIPGNPDYQGLVHFYKKDGEWQFITAENYQKEKDTLPKLSFACRHTINGFKDKEWPDLTNLAQEIVDADKFEIEETGETIEGSNPLYCAFFKDGDTATREYLSEEELLSGGHDCEINPVIFYRVSKPCTE